MIEENKKGTLTSILSLCEGEEEEDHPHLNPLPSQGRGGMIVTLTSILFLREGSLVSMMMSITYPGSKHYQLARDVHRSFQLNVLLQCCPITFRHQLRYSHPALIQRRTTS